MIHADDDVQARQGGLLLAEGLAGKAFEPVSHHRRAAGPSADGKSQARLRKAVGRDVDLQRPALEPPTHSKDLRKLARLPQSTCAAEALRTGRQLRAFRRTGACGPWLGDSSGSGARRGCSFGP